MGLIREPFDIDFVVDPRPLMKAQAQAQAINYCEAYNIADGLLINFGGKSLDFKRVYNKNLVNPKIK